MSPRNVTAHGASITAVEARNLLRSISSILNAMGEGNLTIDGAKLGNHDGKGIQSPTERRVTVKELRAQAAHMAPRQPKARKRTRKLQPRVVYDLVTPKDGPLNLDGLTEGAVNLVKYLSLHQKQSIKDMFTAMGVKRSTVANMLTVLRKRNLVTSSQATTQ